MHNSALKIQRKRIKSIHLHVLLVALFRFQRICSIYLYIRLLVIQGLNLLKKDVKKHSPFQKVPYPVMPFFLQFI